MNNINVYGTPSEFAITQTLEGLKHQYLILKDEIEDGEIVGNKKKYLQALIKLNNKLVDEYNKKGGDATGYIMEFEKDNSISSVAI